MKKVKDAQGKGQADGQELPTSNKSEPVIFLPF